MTLLCILGVTVLKTMLIALWWAPFLENYLTKNKWSALHPSTAPMSLMFFQIFKFLKKAQIRGHIGDVLTDFNLVPKVNNKIGCRLTRPQTLTTTCSGS